MKNKFLKATLGVALSTFTIGANAQTKYTEGIITYNVQSAMGAVDTKTYFKGDSSLYSAQQGPANIKVITKAGEYMAVLVDVPAANVKKAGIATPAEIEEFEASKPKFSFTKGTETKEISGFKCQKMTIKDEKSGSTYDAWITNDISIPPGMLSYLLKDIGGVPVQFTTLQMGQAINVTLKSISGDKVPAGTFNIPAGYEKGTLADLKPGG